MSDIPLRLPEGLSLEYVMDVAEADLNTGFCLSCGAEHDCCEPDARGYECDSCGEHRVYGAFEIVMMFA